MNTEIEYIKNRAQGIARYSDKLREQMSGIDKPFRDSFKAAGIMYSDSEQLFSDDIDYMRTDFYRLKITKIEGVWGIWIRKTNNLVREENEWEDFSTTKRGVLKAAAKRILPFLTAYSKVLAEKLNEYHDLTEKTERMAKAISS